MHAWRVPVLATPLPGPPSRDPRAPCIAAHGVHPVLRALTPSLPAPAAGGYPHQFPHPPGTTPPIATSSAHVAAGPPCCRRPPHRLPSPPPARCCTAAPTPCLPPSSKKMMSCTATVSALRHRFLWMSERTVGS